MAKNSIPIDIQLRQCLRYSYLLLTAREKRELIRIIIASFISGAYDVISLTIVFPLVSLIVEPALLEKNIFINSLWKFLGSPEETRFILMLAISSSLVVISANCLNLITIIQANRFASSCQERLGKNMFNSMIKVPYEWHLINNPNLIAKIFENNAEIWNKNVIRVFPTFAGQLASICVPILTLFTLAPKSAIFIIAIAISFLYFLIVLIQNKVSSLNKRRKETQENFHVFISETLLGIKDIKLSSRDEYFIKSFSSFYHTIVKNFASVGNWTLLPTYLVLILGQIAIIFTSTLLYLNGLSGGEIASIMAIAVLVFLRIVPSINKLSSGVNSIINSHSWIERLDSTIRSLKISNSELRLNKDKIKQNHSTWRKVELKDIVYKYPQSNINVLNSINISIEKGLHYAFVGPSGSGKSTTIDILLGLLTPIKGQITVDGEDINKFGIENWQSNISYVPQQPLISNLSLRENVAFGIPLEFINDELVLKCLRQTDLIDVANSLPNGIYSKLGDRGIIFSGGQKQRVAISRALYNEPNILMLDEATSSLDTISEKAIKTIISNLKGEITVVSIAHRLSTIKSSDMIYVFEKGKINNRGSYEELSRSSRLFKLLSSQEEQEMKK